MGFFKRLLRREARKIISNVVDDVVDNVIDNIRDSGNTENKQTSAGAQTSTSTSVTDSQSTSTQKTWSARTKAAKSANSDEDWANSPAEVGKRIESVIQSNWGDQIEIRQNISASLLDAEEDAMDYTYGFYHNGSLIAVANVLPDGTDYWHKRVRLAKEACERRGIGYVHFLMRLPNRKSYIEKQLKNMIHIV